MHPQQIVNLLRTLGRGRGWKDSTIGTYAKNDSALVARLDGGGTCTLATASKIIQWASDHWPDGERWPVDIPRPIPAREEAE